GRPSAWNATCAAPRPHPARAGRRAERDWRGSLLRLDEVVELVGMRAVRRDREIHLARDALELAGARVRHHRDGGGGLASDHGRAVLQHEAAGAPLERPGDALEGDVGGGALHLGVGGEHLAFADRLELAVKALVDGEAPRFGARAVWVSGFWGSTFTSEGPVAGWPQGRSLKTPSIGPR